MPPRPLIFQISRRYRHDEQPTALYDAVHAKLTELSPPWGLREAPFVSMKEPRGAHVHGVKYTKLLKPSPVKNYVIGFANRARTAPPEDRSTHDDSLMVEFYPHKVAEPWPYLMDVVFPWYVAATGAYCGALLDGHINVDDATLFDPETGAMMPNPAFVDRRLGVGRIWQANYWDRELCRRSFNLEPEAIVERLAGKVAKCWLFLDGVIVICCYEPLFDDAIRALNDTVLPALKAA